MGLLRFNRSPLGAFNRSALGARATGVITCNYGSAFIITVAGVDAAMCTGCTQFGNNSGVKKTVLGLAVDGSYPVNVLSNSPITARRYINNIAGSFGSTRRFGLLDVPPFGPDPCLGPYIETAYDEVYISFIVDCLAGKITSMIFAVNGNFGQVADGVFISATSTNIGSPINNERICNPIASSDSSVSSGGTITVTPI